MSRTLLGDRRGVGKIDTSGKNPFGNGFWTVTFDPAIFSVSTGQFEIYHVALKGPAGSRVQWYIDETFYDITNHGDVNSWDPNEACSLMGGNTIFFYWNTAALPIPTVTVWLREPALLT